MEDFMKIQGMWVIGALAVICMWIFAGMQIDANTLPSVVSGADISTYKNSCIELNISKLADDLSYPNGKNVKLTGRIENFTRMEDDWTDFSLNVSGLSTKAFVSYGKTIPYDIGDNITVYGEYYFPIELENTPGLSHQELIQIRARYIEKA
jgi:hypothetical protein